MKARLAVIAAGALAWCALGPMGTVAASGANGLAWGYWWEPQQQAITLPAPPQVPAKGLYVSANSSGLQAISAVTFHAAPGVADPKLVLHVASLNDLGAFALAAYPTTGPWRPVSAGAWSQRPTFGPLNRRVVGALSSDRSTITFDLGPFAIAGAVDVVIAPVPTSTAPEQYPTVDAAFDAPKHGDVSSTPSPTPPSVGSPNGKSEASVGGNGNRPTGSGANAHSGPNAAPAPTVPSVAVTAGQQPAAPPVVAPPVTTAPVGAPTAQLTPAKSGRSTRDTLILAFLLANTLTFLFIRGRNASRGPGAVISIYDLPPQDH